MHVVKVQQMHLTMLLASTSTVPTTNNIMYSKILISQTSK